MYLENYQKKKKHQNPNHHVKTQVKHRPWAVLGSTINTDWDEREGGKEKALITPKTPSTNKAVAKAVTSTDQSCFRDAALQPSLQQTPGLGCLRTADLKVIQGAGLRNRNDDQGESL